MALVDYFRESADIMIATEAAGEGLNLQFCSLVVNYDLPWNPQRIEQRIGRCHRYGQKHDVVVVNFVNIRNYADVRVFNSLTRNSIFLMIYSALLMKFSVRQTLSTLKLAFGKSISNVELKKKSMKRSIVFKLICRLR
ncbi:helicase-related protein [Parabacteroides merdae]